MDLRLVSRFYLCATVFLASQSYTIAQSTLLQGTADKLPEVWSRILQRTSDDENIVIPVRALDASAAILIAGSKGEDKTRLERIFPGVAQRNDVLIAGNINGWQLRDDEIVWIADDGPAARSGFLVGDRIVSQASSISTADPVPSRSAHGVTKDGVEFHREINGLPRGLVQQVWGETSVWVNNNVKLRSRFVRRVKTELASGVFVGDFETNESRGFTELSRWIQRRGGVWQRNESTGALGCYIAAVSRISEKWKTPFDPERTQTGQFGADAKPCTYMIHNRIECRHITCPLFQTVLLPLENSNLVFVAPTSEHTLKDVITWFSDNGIDSVIDSLSSAKPVLREIHIPRFRFESNLKIRDVLPEGLHDQLLGPGVRYDAMFSGQTGYLSDVELFANVSCDESGFDSTGVAVAEVLFIAEEQAIRIDQPFLFFCVNLETELIDVIGSVHNPQFSNL